MHGSSLLQRLTDASVALREVIQVAKHLLARWCVPAVIVENRPGGSGALAASAMKRAKPDGYTLLVQYSGYQVITPHLVKSSFDPIKDFAPVANLIVAPQVVVVRPDLPVKSKAEAQGAYVVYMNPQELGNHTSKEFQSWGKFVKDAKITGE
jgi:tripartite-type tricarboxylate transporter receptor subunit TctC